MSWSKEDELPRERHHVRRALPRLVAAGLERLRVARAELIARHLIAPAGDQSPEMPRRRAELAPRGREPVGDPYGRGEKMSLKKSQGPCDVLEF